MSLNINQLLLIKDLYQARDNQINIKKLKASPVFESLPPFIKKCLNYHYKVEKNNNVVQNIAQTIHDNKGNIAAAAAVATVAVAAYVKRDALKNGLTKLISAVAK